MPSLSAPSLLTSFPVPSSSSSSSSSLSAGHRHVTISPSESGKGKEPEMCAAVQGGGVWVYEVRRISISLSPLCEDSSAFRMPRTGFSSWSWTMLISSVYSSHHINPWLHIPSIPKRHFQLQPYHSTFQVHVLLLLLLPLLLPWRQHRTRLGNWEERLLELEGVNRRMRKLGIRFGFGMGRMSLRRGRSRWVKQSRMQELELELRVSKAYTFRRRYFSSR